MPPPVSPTRLQKTPPALRARCVSTGSSPASPPASSTTPPIPPIPSSLPTIGPVYAEACGRSAYADVGGGRLVSPEHRGPPLSRRPHLQPRLPPPYIPRRANI